MIQNQLIASNIIDLNRCYFIFNKHKQISYINMQEKTLKVQDIEANYQSILNIVGQDSFVNWDQFIKSSTQLNKQMEQLARGISIYRQIQQKRFINSMKKLKSIDIPDLIKTVRAKKLPKEALKTILKKFEFDLEGKIKLVGSVEDLKAESDANFKEYVSVNQVLFPKLKQTTDLIAFKIHQSGLYQQPEAPKQLVSTFKANFSQAKLQQLRKTIKVQYQPGTDQINIQTYGQIVHNTLELVKDQYKRLTFQTRQKQRSLINDSKKYVQVLTQYLTNTEALILEGQRLIAKTIGLEQKKVEESQVGMMEKGLAQTVLLIQAGLRTSVKQSIVPKNQVNFETTKKIVKNQIQLIKQKTPIFKEMFKGIERTPQNFQTMPLIIALTLNDFIYLTYKLEEEDFMKSVNDQIVMNNPEVSTLFKQMQNAIIKLMQETGIISEDMAKVIQMQSQQIQSQAGDFYNNIYGPNPQGGVFPGSNPQDLLQQMQRHQLDQMMGKKL